jgi:hypothetical protein
MSSYSDVQASLRVDEHPAVELCDDPDAKSPRAISL